MNEDQIQNPFSFIADFEGDIRQLTEQPIPPVLPILPLRGLTMFPCVMSPVAVRRKGSLDLVRHAYEAGTPIGAFCQRNANVENPTADDLYPTGVVARVVKMLELPDGQLSVILQASSRIHLGEVIKTKPYMKANVEQLKEFYPGTSDWHYFETVVDIEKFKAACRRHPNPPATLQFRAGLYHQPGTFWVDDLEIIPLEKHKKLQPSKEE